MIRIEALVKSFGGVAAVDGIELAVEKGEFFALLGGSGSGKTTLLRMIAGFETPDSGRILIDGVDMADAPPHKRPVNLMFQSYALFPHMSVRRNIEFGLRQDFLRGAELKRRTDEALELVAMADYATRKPDQLSGGQKQRVALARALVKRPKVLLLDEPLSALDRKLREATQMHLVDVQKRTGVTFVVVTHDQDEAMMLASRVAVMNAGRIEQIGAPADLYAAPKNLFVASFIGATNLLAARGAGGTFVAQGLACLVAALAPETETGDVRLSIRPENIKIRPGKIEPPAAGQQTQAAGPERKANHESGVVEATSFYGDHTVYHVRAEGGALLRAAKTNALRHGAQLAPGQRVTLSWPPEAVAALPS